MAKWTMVTHGNNVVPERFGGSVFADIPGVGSSDQQGMPQGYGRSFRGKPNQGQWFHAMPPTPAVANNERVSLHEVFIMLDIQAPAVMRGVHVWDGADVVQRIDGRTTTGDRLRTITDGQNGFAIYGPLGSGHVMSFGLCVSMFIEFGAQASTVRFASIGAHFDVSFRR